jgi:hypothetical protein
MAGQDWLDVDSARWPTIERNYAMATGPVWPGLDGDHTCAECATSFSTATCPTCGERLGARPVAVFPYQDAPDRFGDPGVLAPSEWGAR